MLTWELVWWSWYLIGWELVWWSWYLIRWELVWWSWYLIRWELIFLALFSPEAVHKLNLHKYSLVDPLLRIHDLSQGVFLKLRRSPMFCRIESKNFCVQGSQKRRWSSLRRRWGSPWLWVPKALQEAPKRRIGPKRLGTAGTVDTYPCPAYTYKQIVFQYLNICIKMKSLGILGNPFFLFELYSLGPLPYFIYFIILYNCTWSILNFCKICKKFSKRHCY